MTRRRFAFWLGLGLFSLAGKLRANGLDDFAAAIMRRTEPSTANVSPPTPEHWTVAENRTWRWYERENLIDGQWTLTGITTPINKNTGRPFAGRSDYLENSLVPAEVRLGVQEGVSEIVTGTGNQLDRGQPSAMRRARHGRPPSKWLRSLHADEIRIWLKTIEIPEAGVSGMTFWTHLTRDHSFDPEKITGLTVVEQTKLHAAAHYGY